MEFLIELLFEIILEGSIELGSEKTVPMPLRILAAVLVLVGFFGIGGMFIYTGYDAMLANNMAGATVAFVAGACIVFGGIFVIFKMFQKKKAKKEE